MYVVHITIVLANSFNFVLLFFFFQKLWALSLFHIVHLVSSNVPPHIFQLMKSDKRIKEILMVIMMYEPFNILYEFLSSR